MKGGDNSSDRMRMTGQNDKRQMTISQIPAKDRAIDSTAYQIVFVKIWNVVQRASNTTTFPADVDAVKCPFDVSAIETSLTRTFDPTLNVFKDLDKLNMSHCNK